MENMISERIKQYQTQKGVTYQNAFREVVQEIILYALSTTNFFSIASFCGGTSLRIAYNLSRSSEDLDFTAIKPIKDFSFEEYFPSIYKVFKQLGIDIKLSEKKTIGNVKSAFLKSDTLANELFINNPNPTGLPPSLKIKLEIDTNPPEGANYEFKSSLFPFPHKYLIQDLPSLFAGKIHALLCRNWEKGRDYYDYLFYLRKGADINMSLLESAIRQTNSYELNNGLDYSVLETLLISKFNNADFETAKLDCLAFVNSADELAFWDKDLFIDVTKQYFSNRH